MTKKGSTESDTELDPDQGRMKERTKVGRKEEEGEMRT